METERETRGDRERERDTWRERVMKGGVFVQKAVCSEGDSQVMEREREESESHRGEWRRK